MNLSKKRDKRAWEKWYKSGAAKRPAPPPPPPTEAELERAKLRAALVEAARAGDELRVKLALEFMPLQAEAYESYCEREALAKAEEAAHAPTEAEDDEY